jgi:hypothetical protein
VGGSGGKRTHVCVSVSRFDPVIPHLLLPDAVLETHGCYGCYQMCRTQIVMAQLSRLACIDKGPVGGPQAHDDAHRCAASRTARSARCSGCALLRLASDGVCLHDHPAEGVCRDGTAGVEQAEMTDFHEAIGQDVLEESADTLAGVEMSRAWTCTAGFTGGEGDGAVCEAHDTSVGDSDPEDIRSEGGAGRVSVVIGLPVDIPGDGPALRIDVFQQSSCVHLLFPQSAVDG